MNVLIPKLSKASKMPCESFSLPVNDDVCKGMRDLLTNEMKDVCKGCYAKKGNYRYPNVINAREHNYQSSLQLDNTFVNSLIEQIKDKSYFRWFDSGDIYSQKLLERILFICVNTPNTKHWIPTKARELFDQDTWKNLEALHNVKVRYSSPYINGKYNSKHGSTVFEKDTTDKNIFKCPATTVLVEKINKKSKKIELKPRGTCDNCRACWTNDRVIGYKLH